MRRAGYLLSAGLAVCLALGAIALFLSGPLTTRAVQNPRISLDMDPAGNSYDPATNTMTVGMVDSCLASPEANPSTHTHRAHLVIQNVEDLVGWQARLNYNGDEMRPANVNFDPFQDTTTGQGVSFINLPKDRATSVHRDITPASAIPPAAPGLQSALIGAAYIGPQDAPSSPDTPAKSPADDSSYSAPNGGVLASVDLEVEGDQSGRTLFMQMDDGNPNPPGSALVVFIDRGLSLPDYLPQSDLSSGFHAEGKGTCSPVPMPTNAPTSATNADVALTSLQIGAPESVEAGKFYDLNVALTIQNRGPDDVTVGYGGEMQFDENCTGPWQIGGGTDFVPALTEVRKELIVSFACAGPPDGTRSITIRAIVTAYALYPNQDLNPFDNGRTAQATVTVLGTASLPTPTPPYQPPAGLVADISVTGGNVYAPDSVKAGEPFDIRLSVTVANEGPDDVDGELLASYGSDSNANCLTGPDYRMFWDLGHLAASTVSQFDVRNEITCYGSSSPVTPATFYLGVTAYALAATDPNLKNNEWAVQRVISIMGTAPLPTPAPVQDPPIDPSQVPDSPPSNPGVVGSSSGGSPLKDPAVAHAGVQTPGAAVLGVAALPQTGEAGAESGPNWGLLAAAGVVLGVAAGAVLTTRRLTRRS